MRLVFQAFVDRLVESKDSKDLREGLAETATALNISCFAYLALPRATRRTAAADFKLSLNLDFILFAKAI